MSPGTTDVDAAAWAFQGVFDTKEKAIAACRDDHYFIAPAVLNAEIQHDPIPMDGVEWPMIGKVAPE